MKKCGIDCAAGVWTDQGRKVATVSSVWKAVTEREGIACFLCPWWTREGIGGLNCSREMKVRSLWKFFCVWPRLWSIVTDFLRRLRSFYPWRDFHVLNLDHTQRQRKWWSTHLLEMPLTFCYWELQSKQCKTKNLKIRFRSQVWQISFVNLPRETKVSQKPPEPRSLLSRWLVSVF